MLDKNIQNKINGSLIGGAVGDALGYPIEFNDIETIKRKHGKNGITKYETNGKKALISDDTQMTLFTLNGLLYYHVNKIHHLPEAVIWKAYRDWLNTQQMRKNDIKPICWISNLNDLNVRRAPGSTCLNALMSGKTGTLNNSLNDSKGCGGIMRVAPIGLFYEYNENNFNELCLLGARTSAITHSHPLSHISSYVMTGIVNILTYTNYSIEEAIDMSCLSVRKKFNNYEQELTYFFDLIDKARKLSKQDIDDVMAIESIGGGWIAEETLAIAIYSCLKYQDSFEKAIICSVNHSGDSDSTGAVAGNIIGAYLGYKKIPSKFLKRLEFKKLILELVEDMINIKSSSEKITDEKLIKKYIECKPIKEKY